MTLRRKNRQKTNRRLDYRTAPSARLVNCQPAVRREGLALSLSLQHQPPYHATNHSLKKKMICIELSGIFFPLFSSSKLHSLFPTSDSFQIEIQRGNE